MYHSLFAPLRAALAVLLLAGAGIANVVCADCIEHENAEQAHAHDAAGSCELPDSTAYPDTAQDECACHCHAPTVVLDIVTSLIPTDVRVSSLFDVCLAMPLAALTEIEYPPLAA